VTRTSQDYTEGFRTKKRQRCVMSPLLFNLYMTKIEKKLRDGSLEGVGIGIMRIWSLAYADTVLVANNREAMQDMMKIFF